MLSFDVISGITAGTASASKALVLNASKNIFGINNLSCSGLNLNNDITISNLIYTDYNDGFQLSVAYDRLSTVNASVIRKLVKKINELEQKINNLESGSI